MLPLERHVNAPQSSRVMCLGGGFGYLLTLSPFNIKFTCVETVGSQNSNTCSCVKGMVYCGKSIHGVNYILSNTVFSLPTGLLHATSQFTFWSDLLIAA